MSGKQIATTHPRTFFIVFKNEKQQLEFTLYYQDLPSAKMLAQLRGRVVYKRELFGYYLSSPLSFLIAEFEKRVAEGTLPDENITIKKQVTAKGE